MSLPSILFLPQDQILEALIHLYKWNMHRTLRIRLDQVHLTNHCSLVVLDWPTYIRRSQSGL
ncbi:hypothetical protein CYLTODRAFT_427300 [Cylindrobasidium torrendii FP15055 ss-10]|uniref:Uncharacterized protein n=1 Tax=Cylindrobasidium torrendii FP15055 ss-10 TaxID=1314674 RepID=A0A0D7AUG6_9AGAR|nr:hypothetical protein CYLTODRAFT_427300 [Cylindrobasidium torrendii FP15055 ss-10]